MKTVTCTKCPKKFTKPTIMAARQALRMHEGRVHAQNIKPPNTVHSGILHRRNGNLHAVPVLVGASGKGHNRSHLSVDETTALVGFIQKEHKKYPTRQACFDAALAHVGIENKIKNSSGATARYFAKALNGEQPGAPVKRKYTRRAQPVVKQEIKVNFCPNCGCDIHAVATGIAMAQMAK